MSVLNKICELLKQQGKKQKDLTDFLGITKNSFTDWKSGRIKSYTKHLPEIAEFLGVSTDYLLGIEKNSPSSEENGLSASQRELIALFDSAPPELQAAALAVLKSAEARLQAQDDSKANQ